ncbi:acyl-CoA dehydrogenase family protein [Actinomycetospora endophytica]|uniref:Acyl-CoA dehydrogenase family protein n=1 Tax=Actinomycetospora endophytica TaxID=2291215 RepID=A0ABS8PIF4_9PSEU|nr:acyl-CoA dehydrogenase family protein [Actinomycetospora endophytica]MCD2197171.1 acyl-CoA dehydrogenase family protein [Actinomycetospora endophytica]
MSSTSMSDCSLDRPGTSDEARALRAELVGRAREIVPVLARNAAQTEADRRVVEENIELIDRADLFAIMKPRRLGGLETDMRTKLEVSRELARGCGSTSWAATLMNVCSFFAGLYPDRAQRDLWADSPGDRIAGVLAPTGEATRVEAGYRLSGSWGWASGCLHAQWAVVGFPVPDERGEIVDQGLALVPMSELSISDTWYVAGMRGTGSNTLVARDVFVPGHRVISIPAAIGGRYATEHTDEALYRSAFIPVAALVLAGPQLGLAQAALDLVIEKAPKRSISYTFYEVQTEAPTVQLAVPRPPRWSTRPTCSPTARPPTSTRPPSTASIPTTRRGPASGWTRARRSRTPARPSACSSRPTARRRSRRPARCSGSGGTRRSRRATR